MDNIEIFQETMQIFKENPELFDRTTHSVMDTKEYWLNSQSEKNPYYENPTLSVRRTLTLAAARKLAESHRKVALLNFANPTEPGGGVLRGANAQEEYLCRASNLYLCLKGLPATHYYSSHCDLEFMCGTAESFIATDNLLYSPDVTFIRRDVPGPYGMEQELTDDWLTADVITCAAPWFRDRGAARRRENLPSIFCSRITNILEAAIDNDVDALVLGAFGCGAFHNPPKLVAEAFREVLLQPRYANAFAAVCFAIKPTGKYCENVAAFKQAFESLPTEQ